MLWVRYRKAWIWHDLEQDPKFKVENLPKRTCCWWGVAQPKHCSHKDQTDQYCHWYCTPGKRLRLCPRPVLMPFQGPSWQIIRQSTPPANSFGPYDLHRCIIFYRSIYLALTVSPKNGLGIEQLCHSKPKMRLDMCGWDSSINWNSLGGTRNHMLSNCLLLIGFPLDGHRILPRWYVSYWALPVHHADLQDVIHRHHRWTNLNT